MRTLFTSESVTEGHPDKICDQISDAVLDELLRQDPNARVACEVMATKGKIIAAGEITAKELPDIPHIICRTVRQVGYGGDYEVEVVVHGQSPDIAYAVEGGEELMRMYPEEITVTKEDGTQEKRHPRAVLFTDYTQMAHHGQRGVSRACYESLSPRACLWAAPDWLWDKNNGSGFDCGPWETVRTREWMDALGVTTHLVEKDGTQSFVI